MAENIWGTDILKSVQQPTPRNPSADDAFIRNMQEGIAREEPVPPGLLSTIGDYYTNVTEYPYGEAFDRFTSLLGPSTEAVYDPGLPKMDFSDIIRERSLLPPEAIQKSIETKKINPRTGKTTAGSITPTDLTGPSNEAYAYAMETPGLMAPTDSGVDSLYTTLDGSIYENKLDVRKAIENNMPTGTYPNALSTFMAAIGKETAFTFDYLKKQGEGGPGRGLLQGEIGDNMWRYFNTEKNIWQKNSQPVMERWKDELSKARKIGVKSKKYKDLYAKALKVQAEEQENGFKKGMNDYYEEWLKGKEVEVANNPDKYPSDFTGNSSANQMKFYIQSLENKTKYKIGNSAEILKALKGVGFSDGKKKGNSFSHETIEGRKNALATFIRYATRPGWAQVKLKGGKSRPKSLEDIKKHDNFKETWKRSLKK